MNVNVFVIMLRVTNYDPLQPVFMNFTLLKPQPHVTKCRGVSTSTPLKVFVSARAHTHSLKSQCICIVLHTYAVSNYMYCLLAPWLTIYFLHILYCKENILVLSFILGLFICSENF